MSSRIGVIALAVTIVAVASLSSNSTPPQNVRPCDNPPCVNVSERTKQAAPKVQTFKSPTTDSEKITSAMTAAPAAVSKDATVMDVDGATMAMKTLKKGTNMWTCFPDTPSPGRDPMCVDKNGMEWMNAWLQHKDPPKGKVGFGYMLMGGSDASQTDPFAMGPKKGDTWVDTGPHVMIFNFGDSMTGYPTVPGDTKQPWIMFPGTPYAHLMIPVK